MVTLTISYIIYPVEKCVISTVPTLISCIQIRVKLKRMHSFYVDYKQFSLMQVYKRGIFLSKIPAFFVSELRKEPVLLFLFSSPPKEV